MPHQQGGLLHSAAPAPPHREPDPARHRQVCGLRGQVCCGKVQDAEDDLLWEHARLQTAPTVSDQGVTSHHTATKLEVCVPALTCAAPFPAWSRATADVTLSAGSCVTPARSVKHAIPALRTAQH